MKALLAIVIVLAVCVLLFVTGVFSPTRSKRMQAKVDELSMKAENKSDENAGKLGDATRAGLERSRAAADASARAGRRVHDKVTGDNID